jgi:hypothetical protein
MIDPAHVPDVDANEIVARYVLYRSHVRANHTVKPDAFIPHPHRNLSVTRHYLAAEAELWRVGEKVASERGLKLHGRADLAVAVIQSQKLETVADPIDGNPNHANVKHWPAEKPRQKLIAAELAGASAFRPHPTIAPQTPAALQGLRPNPLAASSAEPPARSGWFVRLAAAWCGFVSPVRKLLRAIFGRKNR